MSENSYVVSDEDRTRFATMVARIWGDPELEARYAGDARSVLAEFGITLPESAPTPEIPAKPEGDLSIEELDSVAAGLSVSSLACAACPVSSFSSLSN
ncbi:MULTISPECIES: hypothetical protein [unclassified Frankia]|uniref:hypothetical protein n=1 Tax=unclassified Frankia TaxID=2632575 RepID=UPI002AD4189D|nr:MULTISPECIES: hypothetical protein [unclassified Frankia]